MPSSKLTLDTRSSRSLCCYRAVSGVALNATRQGFRSRMHRRSRTTARNRILFTPSEVLRGCEIHLPADDARARHILQVLKPQPEDLIKIGIINRKLGLAKVMKRLWSTLACLGVTRVYITGADKVEKVYFGSHALDPQRFTQQLIIGAEQAGDTRLPAVFFSKSFAATLAAVQPIPKGTDAASTQDTSLGGVQCLLPVGSSETGLVVDSLASSAMQQQDISGRHHDSDSADLMTAVAAYASGKLGSGRVSCLGPGVNCSQAAAPSASISDISSNHYDHGCGVIRLLAHVAGGTTVQRGVQHQLEQIRLNRIMTSSMLGGDYCDDTTVRANAFLNQPQLPGRQHSATLRVENGSSEGQASQQLRPIVLAVGPEGGWSEAEVALLTDFHGFSRVTIAGGRTLDTTTAVVSLVSLALDAAQAAD